MFRTELNRSSSGSILTQIENSYFGAMLDKQFGRSKTDPVWGAAPVMTPTLPSRSPWDIKFSPERRP